MSQRSGRGVDILTFSTPVSLAANLQFLLTGLRAGGYVIGRGDAELTEADVPFVHEGHNGAVRLSGQSPCSTLWLVATAERGAPAAALPSYSPRPGASPIGGSTGTPTGGAASTAPGSPASGVPFSVASPQPFGATASAAG